MWYLVRRENACTTTLTTKRSNNNGLVTGKFHYYCLLCGGVTCRVVMSWYLLPRPSREATNGWQQRLDQSKHGLFRLAVPPDLPES